MEKAKTMMMETGVEIGGRRLLKRENKVGESCKAVLVLSVCEYDALALLL